MSNVSLGELAGHPDPGQGESSLECTRYFDETLELYEIANRAMASHTRACSSGADEPGVPRDANRGISAVMQLEECIERWQRCLPGDLMLDSFNGRRQSMADTVLYRQVVLLRLRYVAILSNHPVPSKKTTKKKTQKKRKKNQTKKPKNLTKTFTVSSMPALCYLGPCWRGIVHQITRHLVHHPQTRSLTRNKASSAVSYETAPRSALKVRRK